MKKFIKGITIALAVVLCGLLGVGAYLANSLPDNYKVTQNSGIQTHNMIPVTAKIENNQTLVEAGILNHPDETYQADLMLLDAIPIKTVDVEVVEETQVIPCGTPFGVKIFTQGVVVVGMSDLKSNGKTVNPARSAGLKIGDVITSINGIQVNTNEEVAAIIEKSGGVSLSLSVLRSNMSFEVQITPVKADDGISYKAGLWVRDSSAGIGTLTFYNPEEHSFAGLGHGICDIDTGDLMPLLSGDIVSANISGIVKGEKGTPGELRGYFSNNNAIGNLSANIQTGVYGTMDQCPASNEPMTVAMKQQVVPGKAQILTTIQGNEPQYYDIEIESVNYNEDVPTKNMIVKITDPELLEKTGGIVQGMSGSPIIQNGMLVGAVTHVFVNEPEKGYGIFAENMLENSYELVNSQKLAS